MKLLQRDLTDQQTNMRECISPDLTRHWQWVELIECVFLHFDNIYV